MDDQALSSRFAIVTTMTTHGAFGTPTYWIWAAMLARCRQPTNRAWKNYGGRGIRVCDRWLRFENSLSDMGERPTGLTLDRCDSDEDYTPDNCRWATRTVQGRNTSRVILDEDLAAEIRGRFEYGETISGIAKRFGVSRPTIWAVVTHRTWRTPDSPPPSRFGRNHLRRDNLGRYC